MLPYEDMSEFEEAQQLVNDHLKVTNEYGEEGESGDLINRPRESGDLIIRPRESRNKMQKLQSTHTCRAEEIVMKFL